MTVCEQTTSISCAAGVLDAQSIESKRSTMSKDTNFDQVLEDDRTTCKASGNCKGTIVTTKGLIKNANGNQKHGHHHNGDHAARRPHISCSICFHSFGALVKSVRLFIASHHSQPMYPKMGSIDVFVDLQPVG